MSNYSFILFEETLRRRYPGFSEGLSLSGLPLWAYYRVGDLIDMLGLDDSSRISCAGEASPLGELRRRLAEEATRRYVVLGRSGSVTITDMGKLDRAVRGLKGTAKVRIGKVPADLYIVERATLMDAIGSLEEEGFADAVASLFSDRLFHEFDRIVEVDGYCFLFRDLGEYFRENINGLRYTIDGLHEDLFLRLTRTGRSSSIVTERGVVKNCLIGLGTVIEGTAEDSVLFGNVYVGRGTAVRGSVILPGSTIGEDVLVENSLIAGNVVIRGGDTRIGGYGECCNREHPHILKNGLTVIGRGTSIPPYSSIGAGCLVCLPHTRLPEEPAGGGRVSGRSMRSRQDERIRSPYSVEDGDTLVGD
jgi:hypothetical protein